MRWHKGMDGKESLLCFLMKIGLLFGHLHVIPLHVARIGFVCNLLPDIACDATEAGLLVHYKQLHKME